MKIKMERAAIEGVGLAVPAHAFYQAEVAALLKVESPKAKRFFEHPHIEKRHLCLPPDLRPGTAAESTAALLGRFRENARFLARQAAEAALADASVRVDEIGLICCVTSTGFLVPALSALVVQELGLASSCRRLDVVGMGCNAGLNGLNAVASWCESNPGRKALLICCEVCSAIYSLDGSEESALVNSLFGDGAAALVLSTTGGGKKNLFPRVLTFATHLIPASENLLRFDWNEKDHRFRFVVEKKTPEFIAAEVEIPLRTLLAQAGLRREDIRHWIVHSGGEAILNGVEKKLHLDPADLRHTRSVLREYGNISSGSFLFSYQGLRQEGLVRPGDHGVMITMGPGLTIEMALLRWEVGE